MVFKRAYLFPVMVFIWFPLTFACTYITAVLNQHVVPIFPYISDTGNWAPESCFFGIMLTLGALLLLATIYVRFRQIKYFCEKNDFGSKIPFCNNISMCIACFSTLGMLIVANFQETNALVIHLIGAQLCYGGAVIWQILQVVISFKVFPVIGSKTVNIFRALCTAIGLVLLILCGVFAVLSFTQFRGEDITKWNKADGGYENHLVSTITEWLMTGSLGLFVITFTKEFYVLQFIAPGIILKES